jgi:alkyl hydroperoxide reductase subunit AhpF
MAMGSSSLIGPAERERLRTILERDLSGDVHLLLFVQPPSGLYIPGREEPQTGRQARQLMEELVALSPKLHLDVYDPRSEPDLAREHGVERTPALLIRPWEEEGADGADNGAFGRVRFFGLPSGYEFATVLEDLIDVSRRETRLSPVTRERLATLPGPLHLQVFVTPT